MGVERRVWSGGRGGVGARASGALPAACMPRPPTPPNPAPCSVLITLMNVDMDEVLATKRADVGEAVADLKSALPAVKLPKRGPKPPAGAGGAAAAPAATA